MKGYQLFDLDQSKVFYSQDVKFNELEFGLKECCNVEPIGDDGDISEELGAEDTMPDRVGTENRLCRRSICCHW